MKSWIHDSVRGSFRLWLKTSRHQFRSLISSWTFAQLNPHLFSMSVAEAFEMSNKLLSVIELPFCLFSFTNFFEPFTAVEVNAKLFMTIFISVQERLWVWRIFFLIAAFIITTMPYERKLFIPRFLMREIIVQRRNSSNTCMTIHNFWNFFHLMMDHQ